MDEKAAVLGLSLVFGKVNRGDYRIFAGDDSQRLTAAEVLGVLKDAPFEVYLLTPYSRAAVTGADAKRRYAPPPDVTAATLNADGIIVSIDTGSNFLTADSIDAVVLSVDLGRRIVRPARTALEVRTVSNALGARKSVTVGAFYFRFEDFEQLPLAIFCVQASGRTMKLWVEEEDLAR